jgi:uncharacterized protein YgbK (DUF1537 family)
MTIPLLLGAIADDFTGATDLANNLVRQGMRTVQTMGLPSGPLPPGTQAVVVALKTRTVPAADAVAQALQALAWLQTQGAKQLYFKICSTFDSTPAGNIGPVAEALLEALGTDFCIVTPAFPDNGRTVFKGHLFVGEVLLSDSGMRHHPLTPMTDANLVRVLQAQCRGRVGLVEHAVVQAGTTALLGRFGELRAQGVRLAVVDAITNDDLYRLGPALSALPLIVAGSGVAMALPANHGLKPSPAVSALPEAQGGQAVVAGSCSEATRRQVARFLASGRPGWAVDALQAAADAQGLAGRLVAQASAHLADGPVLVYATAEPAVVAAAQAKLGLAQASAAVEACLAAVTLGLVQQGARQLVLAGGETSGACVQALGVEQLAIGPQIDPGVPWCHAHTPWAGTEGLHLALKSGNFGDDDFFHRAFSLLKTAPKTP